MWDASKCNLCGDCLVSCRYTGYDRDGAIAQITLLMEGKDAEHRIEIFDEAQRFVDAARALVAGHVEPLVAFADESEHRCQGLADVQQAFLGGSQPYQSPNHRHPSAGERSRRHGSCPTQKA